LVDLQLYPRFAGHSSTVKEKVLVYSTINKLVPKKSDAGGFGRRSDSLHSRQHIGCVTWREFHGLGEVGFAHNEHIHASGPRNLIEVIQRFHVFDYRKTMISRLMLARYSWTSIRPNPSRRKPVIWPGSLGA